METIEGNAMLELLAASGPDPDYADQLNLYGRFVGSWHIDNRIVDRETGAANAQVFPSKPPTIIVPFAAGGPSDAMSRILGERMRASLGQSIIVENVAGAGGSIGVGRAMSGRIVSVEPETATVNDGKTTIRRTRVTLLTERGLQQFILEDAENLQFADAGLRDKVGQALIAIQGNRAREARIRDTRMQHDVGPRQPRQAGAGADVDAAGRSHACGQRNDGVAGHQGAPGSASALAECVAECVAD